MRKNILKENHCEIIAKIKGRVITEREHETTLVHLSPGCKLWADWADNFSSQTLENPAGIGVWTEVSAFLKGSFPRHCHNVFVLHVRYHEMTFASESGLNNNVTLTSGLS